LRRIDSKELVARVGEGGLAVQQRPAGGRILDSSKIADVFGLELAPLRVETPVGGKVVGKSNKKVSRKGGGSTAAGRKKKKGATARGKGRV
jgi:hypothetical protein